MTAVPASTPAAPRQRGMTRLAAGLTFVCLVLFLLAIEQKHAVQAWSAIRDDVAPAVGNAAGWAIDGGPGGLSGLKDAVAPTGGPLSADPGDRVLVGEFEPADAATRDTVGAVAFIGARIRLEKGEVFRTQPVRIAAGRDAFTAGQTFAGRLDAPAGAQIEVRRIVPEQRGAAIAPSPLCGGQPPGAIALLHRRDRVDMMLFRARTIVGPDAPPAALCGVWRFRTR